MRHILCITVVTTLSTLAMAEPTEQVEVVPTATVKMMSTVETRSPAHGKAKVQELARGKNAFIGRLWLAPGAAVPLHQDASEEYVVFLEGGGTMTIDGKSTVVGPGSSVYMPAGAAVSFQNGPKETVVIQVFAGPEPAEKYTRWPVIKSAKK